MSPGIDESAAKHLEIHRLGAESPDAPTGESPDAIGSFHVAMNINALVEVKPAVGTESKSMDDVMRVLGAKTAQHDT